MSMNDIDEHFMNVFFDVQSDLPRQGPGDSNSTRKALASCRDLSAAPRVLDIGCGPGAQTLVIAEELPDALITAVDFHAPYLDELRSRVISSGFEGSIQIVPGDMNSLSFAPESFDLVWAEGSAYIMGVANALKAWKPLLKAGGYIALTELVWLTENPPSEATSFFNEEYPAMTTCDEVIAMIDEAGYQLIDHFTLPDKAWWDDYYTPLAIRLSGLEGKYAGDDVALSVIRSVRKEMAVRKSFPESFGYEFFVARK